MVPLRASPWVHPSNCCGLIHLLDQCKRCIIPERIQFDVPIGSDSTTSAKFAFTGVNGGLPTASIAGTTTNVATYLTGEGTAVTNGAHLTFSVEYIQVKWMLIILKFQAETRSIDGTRKLKLQLFLGTNVVTYSLTTVGAR